MFKYMIDKLPKIYSTVKSSLDDMLTLTKSKCAVDKWYTIDDSLLGGHSYSFFKSEQGEIGSHIRFYGHVSSF